MSRGVVGGGNSDVVGEAEGDLSSCREPYQWPNFLLGKGPSAAPDSVRGGGYENDASLARGSACVDGATTPVACWLAPSASCRGSDVTLVALFERPNSAPSVGGKDEACVDKELECDRDESYACDDEDGVGDRPLDEPRPGVAASADVAGGARGS